MPTTDIDDLPRPSGGGDLVEIGANEVVAAGGGGGAPNGAAGGAPNAAGGNAGTPNTTRGAQPRAVQGSHSSAGAATSGTTTSTTSRTPAGHGLPSLLTPVGGSPTNGAYPPSHGSGAGNANRAATGFINAIGNELALVVHNPAALPVGLLLVLLAVPAGMIYYRRRRKGTAR